MLFVLLYYRLAGCVALVGLLLNIVLLFGMMAMFHFVLTLPGIAGIILTIGLAVDANVLLYERLREELAAGKSLGAAIDGAYSKAFSAIFDANATTLITAGILFWQASGPVRGFSITLILGIIASLFSAILFTRTAFRWMMGIGGLKRLTMANLAPRTEFNFLGKRRLAVVVSLALIGGSVAFFVHRGSDNFGIDFRGGDLLVVDAKPALTVAEAREALGPLHLTEETIQQEQAGTQEMLAIRSAVDTSTRILSRLKEAFPSARDHGRPAGESRGPDRRRVRQEGAPRPRARHGRHPDFRDSAFRVLLRRGALVALLHDVVITAGVFSLTGGEFPRDGRRDPHDRRLLDQRHDRGL